MKQQPPLPPPIPFTYYAYEKLKKELVRLEKLREEVVIRLSAAREMGDLSENGAYKYAKQELGNIGRQIRDVRYKLKFGHVVTTRSTNGQIEFGSTITIENNERSLTFMLVSEYESNPSENKLSTASPIGKAVVGKKTGDLVTVQLPQGESLYTITSVT